MSATPVRTEKGVKQSNDPPAKWRPSVSKPWMKAPSTIPCAKAPSAEPSAEGMVPEGTALGIAIPRNSNATPRKTSASSMIRIGK